MPWTLERSHLHFERAFARLPLGVASDGGDGRTLYGKRASGARLWDIDGHEYIDYWLGCGRVILGYAHPRVARAARTGIEFGGVFTLATELESAVAERIANLVPAAERVRFSSSGFEAVLDALRLARDFTGKNAIAVVDGGASGMLGNGSREAGRQNRTQRANSPTTSRGPFGAAIHAVPANDANRFEELLRGHGDRIGAFVIDPLLAENASTAAAAAYLGDVRALCDRFDVILIVDESTAGFRVARGGAQEVLGVRADLCTFGSSAANGFPIAALGGREEIMRGIDDGARKDYACAAHPVSLAAADRTLEIVEKTDALEQIAKYGWRMREGMGQVLSRRGIPHVFTGPPSMSRLCFEDSTPIGDGGRKRVDDRFCGDLMPRLLGSGILCAPGLRGPWFVSAAHNELCLAETLAKFERAIDGALERLPGARRRAADAPRGTPRSISNPG